jgi:hypothetical protein
MNKRQELEKYSDFHVVNKKAKRLLGVGVDVSTRADKKYMIRTPDGKVIHFGAWGMQDFTKHKNKDRLNAFKTRNNKWASAPKWSAGFMSYNLLW